jgi:hypothetical protein
LYTVVALLYAQLPAAHHNHFAITWPGKNHAAFSDAIVAVRRWLWVEWAFVTHGQNDTFTKLPSPLRKLLLYALTPGRGQPDCHPNTTGNEPCQIFHGCRKNT